MIYDYEDARNDFALTADDMRDAAFGIEQRDDGAEEYAMAMVADGVERLAAYSRNDVSELDAVAGYFADIIRDIVSADTEKLVSDMRACADRCDACAAEMRELADEAAAADYADMMDIMRQSRYW